MELYRLNSKFELDTPVENYDSLIWSERYSKAGDFQFVSGNIGASIAALPLESVVSLRSSLTPMVVETYSIEKDARTKSMKITISGRSYEACAFEKRASVSTMPTSSARATWLMPAATPSDAAYRAIRTVIGDVARSQNGSQVLAALSPALSPNDAFPTISLTLPADFSTATPNNYEIKADELYKTVLELLSVNNRGIKSVRPVDGSGKIGVEIYNGANLTDLVVFDARFEQLDKATYLLSNQSEKDVAYVYGANGSRQVLKTSAPEPSGMDRRVLLVDDVSDTTSNTDGIRYNRGLIQLFQNNVTTLFDGEVAQQVASDFNNKYFMGDIVKLTGDYGLSQNARISEFIRSSDAQGEKAYPTFEAVAT